jgi:hypothetical protein
MNKTFLAVAMLAASAISKIDAGTVINGTGATSRPPVCEVGSGF